MKGGRKEGRKEDERNKVKEGRKIKKKGCRREYGGRKVKERRNDAK